MAKAESEENTLAPKNWEDRMTPEDREKLEAKRQELFGEVLAEGYKIARVVNQRSGRLLTAGSPSLIAKVRHEVYCEEVDELTAQHIGAGTPQEYTYVNLAFLPKDDYWQRRNRVFYDDLEEQTSGLTIFSRDLSQPSPEDQA